MNLSAILHKENCNYENKWLITQKLTATQFLNL